MKHAVLLIAAWAGIGLAEAQVWCPPGAQWWYSLNGVGGATGYVHVQYAADTLIDGQASKKLTAHAIGIDQSTMIPFDFFYPALYTAQIGDIVALYADGVFDTLFHYQALPGDEWMAVGGLPPETNYTVADTGSMVVSGQSLHWWAVDIGNNPNLTSDTLVERLGGLQEFLDPSAILGTTDPEIWALRCYSDMDISYTAPNAPACDFILGLGSHGAEAVAKVFPNPGRDWIQIAHPSSHTLRGSIVDVNGRTLFTGDVSKHDRLNVTFLAPGYYMLRLSDRHGAILGLAPFIKE